MGIFANLFGKKNTTQNSAISLFNNPFGFDIFTPYGEDFIQNEVFKTCVRVNASYAAKIEAKSVRKTSDGRKSDYPKLDYLLQVEPNRLMNASTFYERISSYYDMYNNAFIWIQKNSLGELEALWSIDPTTMEIGKSTQGEWICKFFVDGIQMYVPYDDMVHIARDVIASDVWGSDNVPIKQIIELINTTYQGMDRAIRLSGVIRFLGEFTTKMAPAEMKRRAKKFTSDYLSIDPNDPNKDQIGIAMSDSIMKLTQLNQTEFKTANFREQESIDQKVYNYLQCPIEIVKGTASKDQRAGYIETRLVPFMMKLKQELERKVFTRNEYNYHNRILIKYDSMQYLPLEDKTKFISAIRELGIITIGQLGEILDIEVPAGQKDKFLISQNYMDSVKNNENKPKEDTKKKINEGEDEDGEEPKDDTEE